MRLFLMFLLLFTLSSAASRIALIVGNSDYQHTSGLKDPSDDLKRLQQSLEDVEFDVTLEQDLKSKEIAEAVEKFRDRLARDKNNIGFLYYTGHGCRVEHEGYLIPIDVDTTKRLDIKYDALNINKMLESLDSAGNRVNMLFLDACRDVPTGVKGGTKGLGQITDTKKGSLIVYATKAGETAEDNSNFIDALIINITQPKQNVREMAFNISDSVANNTNGKQIPVVFATWLPKIVLSEESITPESKYSLTINPTPANAKVYITNIEPKYRDGMKLKKGSYTIKVKAEGYKTKLFDINLKRDSSYDIVLAQSSKVAQVTANSKWITPSNSVCKTNGGKTYKGVCQANWNNAKKICRASGGRLPSREDLKQVVLECGGSSVTYGNKDWSRLTDKNIANKSYQSCYKQTGFSSDDWYWTREEKESSYAWYVGFYDGSGGWNRKSSSYYALCVR